MAIHAPITGAPSCATPATRYPAAFWRTLINLDRPALEGVIDMAISLLDAADGDPDLETSGTEDDFMQHAGRHGAPGCPISDPDYDVGVLRPRYGINQTRGPINEAAAVREWQEAQRVRYAIG